MIFLLQLLSQIDDKEMFHKLFSGIEEEMEELGYERNDLPDLVNDMLSNHFGLSVEDETQLKSITEVILNPKNFNAAVNVAKLKSEM